MRVIDPGQLKGSSSMSPKGFLDYPTCGGVETANHVLLHCPRTRGVWDEDISAATEGVEGALAERAWNTLGRGGKFG